MSKRAHEDNTKEFDLKNVVKKIKTEISSGSSEISTETSVVVDTNEQSIKLDTSDTPESNPELKAQEETTDDGSIGLSDILSIEHAVGNLQSALKTILTSAANETKLAQLREKITYNESPQIVLALKRSKLDLAAKLKSLYDEKKLPLLDQIVNYEDLKSAITATNDLSIKFDNSDVKSEVKSSEYTLDHLPPIPEIKNAAIRAQVFVHKSLIKDKLYLSEKEAVHAHNERLEFVGDSVLNNIMTLIAYNTFPDATEGELSQLRTRLINNVTLQKWSYKYGLDKELKLNVDDSALRGKLKVYADVFEAYVGGLITEDAANYSVVYNWLKALALPILRSKDDAVIRRANSLEEINTNAKVELYSLIGFASLGLHYETISRSLVKDIPNFVVQVKTKDGNVLGTGEGKNTKEAGMRAAMDALSNKNIIEKYSRLRASIPRETSVIPLENSLKKNKKNSETDKESSDATSSRNSTPNSKENDQEGEKKVNEPKENRRIARFGNSDRGNGKQTYSVSSRGYDKHQRKDSKYRSNSENHRPYNRGRFNDRF